jgi:hypothetical protein
MQARRGVRADPPVGEDAMSRKLLVAVLVLVAFAVPLGGALADDDDDQGEHHGWGHHHGWEEHGDARGWGHSAGWGHRDWGQWDGYAVYGAPAYPVPYVPYSYGYGYYEPYAYGYYQPYGYSSYGYRHTYSTHRHVSYTSHQVIHHQHACCCCSATVASP